MNNEAILNLEIGGRFARMEEVKVFFTLCRLANRKNLNLPPLEEMMSPCGYSNVKNFEKILKHLQRRTLLIMEEEQLKINGEWVSFV